MNIFYLDKEPQIAAHYHNDKHVVKMILESARMLSTAHRELDGDDDGTLYDADDIIYRATHKNHPSTVWVRDNAKHYQWLYNLFESLCDEYTHRYGKEHLTDSKLREILRFQPFFIDTNKRFTQPPQCMPDEYKVDGNSVAAYRNYYMGEKSGFAKWSKRQTPPWWNNNNHE